MTTIPRDPTPTPVRITVDGTATPFGTEHLLRVKYGSAVLLVDPEVDGIEVEYLEPPRTWTDNDVVQHVTEGWTLTRKHGMWRNSQPHGINWTDGMVTKHLADQGDGWAHLRVLRYQAGE